MDMFSREAAILQENNGKTKGDNFLRNQESIVVTKDDSSGISLTNVTNVLQSKSHDQFPILLLLNTVNTTGYLFHLLLDFYDIPLFWFSSVLSECIV